MENMPDLEANVDNPPMALNTSIPSDVFWQMVESSFDGETSSSSVLVSLPMAVMFVGVSGGAEWFDVVSRGWFSFVVP